MSKFLGRTLLTLSALTAAGWVFWRAASDETAADSATLADQAVVPPGADALRVVPPVLSAAPVGSDQRLFSYVQPAQAARWTAAMPAPAHDVHYVRTRADLTRGKASPFWQAPGTGRVEVPLPGGNVVTAIIEGSELLGPDRFISSGRLDGRPGSRVLFAWHEGFLHAEIRDHDLGTFVLRVVTPEFSQLYRVEPDHVLPCGGERSAPRAAASSARSAQIWDPSWNTSSPNLAAAENAQHAEVHLMMVHSQAVLPTMSGKERTAALQSAFDLAVAKVNEVLDASLVTARVKLVKVVETAYDESVSAVSKIQDDALTALYLEGDGKMDELHALRDQAGADVVCLALQRRDSASSGLSFLLSDANDSGNARFAFSVVQYTSVAGTNVLAHELGHLFGCAHDRENALSGPGSFGYSYGYRFFGSDGAQYHDIMSYPPGIELGYYSNPRVLAPRPAAVPVGIAAGLPGESDSAQTIERNAFAISTYRLQTQAAVSPGTLVNVATRAFVGRGEEVLIGGFVVRGSRPKAMLIRAAGPALAGFGVNGVLADPVLSVFSGGTLVAANDNWMLPQGPGAASAAEILAATSHASAFPFPDGSRDAAVLVTLAPGAYTAVVEGADAGSGAGLIEAYEVESDAAKIVNLATRGYAGRDGREMVGGFVVRGGAGSTKRILIRVLGPSLARAPFKLVEAMDDPELELRSASGELLLRSDDWSSGAEGGASPQNDFSPFVRLYGEKQIFATGLAPSNRREPCVLVDLPPGNYTVIVRPFEEPASGTTPAQPAKPGVGVVEVYEIEF
jgi:hypothetical protein